MLLSNDSITRAELQERIAELEAARDATNHRFEERQHVLISVSSMLASSQDYEETLQSAAQLALPALADWCSVLLLEGRKLRRVARASVYEQDSDALNRMQSTIALFEIDSRDDRLLTDGHAELISNFDSQERLRLAVNSDHAQALQDLGTCSVIRAPLIARDRSLGLIIFAYSRSGRQYSEADIPLIEEIAHSAAFAIDNTRLYHAARRKVAELNTIQRIASLINSTAPLETVFQDIIEIVGNAFNYRMLSIYLLDGEYLHLQAYLGYEQVVSSIHISSGISGRVVRTGKLVFTRDARQEPDFIQAFDAVLQGINAPLKNADGTVIGILSLESTEDILTDDDVVILELVANQISVAVANARLFDALRDSEKRYRALIDQAADAIIVTDGAWCITDANMQAVRMFGDQRERLIGQSFHQHCIVDTSLEHWVPRSGMLFQIRTSTGGACPVEASVNAIIENHQLYHIIILRDISDRLRGEALQQATQRQLLESQKLESLGVLVGGIAHDFNNLLMAILGNVGLASLELPDQSDAHISLTQIEAAARRAVDLTQQMLAYAGKVYLEREPISLSEIVDGIIPLLRSIINPWIEIECQLAPDLPLVMADSSQLRRVVLSLATNAGEAIGDQPGVITIATKPVTLSGTPADDEEWSDLYPGIYAALIVTDTGCGIDPAIMPQIFDPFFSTKTVSHGLGLSAAQGIIRTHRGLLRAQSTMGQGARFTILLPATTMGEPSIIGA